MQEGWGDSRRETQWQRRGPAHPRQEKEGLRMGDHPERREEEGSRADLSATPATEGQRAEGLRKHATECEPRRSP